MSNSNPNPNPNRNRKLITGDRVRCYLADGSIDEVVYTVQGFVRRGNQRLPWVSDCWQPVVLTRWVLAT